MKVVEDSYDYIIAGGGLAGCVLAYRTRDLDPKYGEAKQLGTSTFSSTSFLMQ